MRVVLAYPPDFQRATMMFGAIPLFNACLKAAGHETHLLDINAESFAAMMEPSSLERYLGILDTIHDKSASIENPTDAERATTKYYRGFHAYPREVMLQAGDAIRGMHDPERYYDPAEYTRMDRVLRTAHEFIHGFTPKFDARSSNFNDRLYDYLENHTTDPYYEYYVNDLAPRIAALKPDLVAFSCPFTPQVPTGMFFVKFLKQCLPDVKILMGGTGVSDNTQILLTDERFYDYADFAVEGDGEEAIVHLADALEGKRDLDDVAGLWRREEGKIVRPMRYHNVDMDASLVPDYSDVDTSHYLIPEQVAIYTTSRGCYYGKCTFCPENFRLNFRKRSPQNVYRDLKAMVLEQGIHNFYFFDPLTPPATLEYISRQVKKDKLPINWYAEVKFEPIYTKVEYVRKLSEGGCRQLQFGLESGVQRVLDDMDKGNRLEQIDIMLDNLHTHGISTAVTWFIGFPTEDEDDARETWRYIRKKWDRLHLSLYVGTFGLDEHVPVYKNPAQFGIEIIERDDGVPYYRRLDGNNWDQQPQQEAYHTRSDVPANVGGAGLLYAVHNPDLLFDLRGIAVVGPTSFEDPNIEDRTAHVPDQNNWISLDPEDAEEKTDWMIYVASSGLRYESDRTDVDMLEAVNEGACRLGDILERFQHVDDARERMVKFVDRGYIESPDPILLEYRAGKSVAKPEPATV